MKVILDRFEGEFAVVEMMDKTMVNMPKILLPKFTKEGDIIEITVDEEATEKRKKVISRLMGEVWEK
jgi:hypothetical protein